MQHRPVRRSSDIVKTIRADLRQTKAADRAKSEHLSSRPNSTQPTHQALAGVLDVISDGFIALSADWIITFVNKAGREMLGENAAVGLDFWSVYPELIGTPVEEAYRTAAGERTAVAFEHNYVSLGKWFEVHVVPAEDNGVSIFLRDNSAQKRSIQQVKELKAQLQVQTDDLRRLYLFNSRLAATATLNDMLQEVLNAALDLHAARKGLISLGSSDSTTLRLAFSAGFSSEFLRCVESVPRGAGACGLAFETKQNITVADVETDSCFEHYRDAAKIGGFRAVHSTPMITPQGRLIGVLSVHFEEKHRPTEREVQLTNMYAQKAADLLANALLRQDADKELADRKRSAEQMRDLKLALETQVADLRNLQQLNRLNEDRFRMAAGGDAITLYEQDDQLRYTWLYPIRPENAGSLGRTDSQILTGPEGQLLETWKREVMATGVPQRREITMPLESGERCYDMSIHARRDHTGMIIGVAGAAVDVTERNRAIAASRQLAAIVESSEDAILSEDLNGIVTSWNKSAERIFGHTAEEIIGKSISTVIPGSHHGEQPELTDRILKGQPVAYFETMRQRKDGRPIHVSISVSPLRNEAHEIVGASKIVRDITERKRREEQERAIYELATQVNRAAAMSEIFEAALDAIMRCQSADRASILLYDKGGVMRFKCSRGLSEEYQRAVEGHSPWRRDDPDARPVCVGDVSTTQLDEALRNVVAKEGIRALAFIPITYEGHLLGKFMVYYNGAHEFNDAELRPVQTIATQVAFAIQRQQTEQQLERLVDERTTSLRQAVQQMEEFSYTISHDLRAPLRAMQVYSQALLEDFAGSLSPEGIRYVKRLSENATRLDKMILDVLSFSRVARGDHPMEPVPLDKLVREIVQHYPEMQPPKAELLISQLADVVGHEPSLTQIISNLLSNAVKFVPAGVLPRVKLWTENHGEHVRLFVHDNGIGIPAQYHHRLFNMFERVHPHLPYEGTGVGLAIVRKAVERMGGKFGLHSEPGLGSKFWIELPAVNTTS